MKNLAESKVLKLLILVTVVANAFGMVCPVLISGDANLYAAVSRHMALHNDWMNLYAEGADWLDKPHFPFWMSAACFKVLGISAASFIFSGFVFHLVGGYYTYKLARQFYGEGTALLAALVYFTTLHLVLSTIDVRAEVFLTGLIMPACYYWLRFDETAKARYLLAGAAFTACAIMTKGIFVLVTIGSGLACRWAYRRQWRQCFRLKWLLALLLCFVFILPELIALYAQFDAHPEKVVFGHQGVSGLRFFFWDSQFGRFFNTGPIRNQHGSPFFYLHTFLWSFLPWTVAFLGAVFSAVRSLPRGEPGDRSAAVFLYGSFLIPFVMFSATKFQFDYYLDILLPFAGIISAKYLHDALGGGTGHSWLPVIQQAFSVGLLGGILVLSLLAVQRNLFLAFTIVFCVAVLASAFRTRRAESLFRAVILPALAVIAVFVFVATVFEVSVLRHEASHGITSYLRRQPRLPVYLLDMDNNEGRFIQRMEMQGDLVYTKLNNLEQAKVLAGSFYLVAEESKLPSIQVAFPSGTVLCKVDRLEIQHFDRAYRVQTAWPTPFTRMAIVRLPN